MKLQNLIRENVRDEYGLLELQNVILNIMQYIDRLCQENRIQYYIIGGTALGAVRHGGFIPWDDDLDIAMTRENYNKFIDLCNSNKFDREHFYFQEGSKDWTSYFSKVRLLNTVFEDAGEDETAESCKSGIFVDIFPLDNVPQNILKKLWWYFSGKLLVAYETSTHNYITTSVVKKFVIKFASILRYKSLRGYFERQVEKYNMKETGLIGGHSLVSRYRNTFTSSKLFGIPVRIPFEKISLLAPEDVNGFLTFYFGDYMTLPPIESRKGHHIVNVDFGPYKQND